MIKATYHLDSKEPKEKHVLCKLDRVQISNSESFLIDLIECFKGLHYEISP